MEEQKINQIYHSINEYLLFCRPVPDDFPTAWNEWLDYSGMTFENEKLRTVAMKALESTMHLSYEQIARAGRYEGII